MPLTEQVSFKARLQKENRLQIPKNIRCCFKLEADQYLKVTIDFLGLWSSPQTFLIRIRKDGRIVVPKLNRILLEHEKLDFENYVAKVTLEPSNKS